jgi:hypothetical protein
MSFFDSISEILGTDGSNNGLLPGISNALGTDGSKNGLLNDPYSMAALALAGGAYLGYIPVGGTAAAGGEVAVSAAATEAAAAYAGEAALTDLAIVAPYGSSAVASVTAGSEAAAWSLPSWATLSNAQSAVQGLSLANSVFGAKPKPQGGQPMYGMVYQGQPQSLGYGTRPAAAPMAQTAAQGINPLWIAAAVAAFALSR